MDLGGDMRERKRNAVAAGVVALLVLLGAATPSFAATPPNWVSVFNAWNVQFGGRFYLSTDENALAYGEAHLLEAYSVMYEATGDTQYLQDAVTHINAIFATAA